MLESVLNLPALRKGMQFWIAQCCFIYGRIQCIFNTLNVDSIITILHQLYRVGQRTGPQTHHYNSVKSYRFRKFFSWRFLGKFAVKCILKIPPHLAFVATQLYNINKCKTLLTAKQAINNKLQGSVAAYLRCGGVVNNQIKKGLLLSVRVKKIFKSVNIFPLIWLGG